MPPPVPSGSFSESILNRKRSVQAPRDKGPTRIYTRRQSSIQGCLGNHRHWESWLNSAALPLPIPIPQKWLTLPSSLQAAVLLLSLLHPALDPQISWTKSRERK